MKLLAIDTATEACSAALLIGDEISERYELAPRRHAELILPMVDSLLAEAELGLKELDALAFGRGPGAFTGIRIATGVAQGLAFGADLPVLPISTLAALAQGAAGQNHPALLCAIDARMGEVYWGVFEILSGIATAAGTERVGKPETVTAGDRDCFGIGSGWLAYEETLRNRLGQHYLGCREDCYPRARDMLPLARIDYDAGRAVNAMEAAPVYLRDRVTS
ncbi:MAG: tRNA (adenosine(37)-N6)-threonylcarbamoyltransferase complex dimerization subunit type 1 TsaB [Gammaproteobacteria bacterium]